MAERTDDNSTDAIKEVLNQLITRIAQDWPLTAITLGDVRQPKSIKSIASSESGDVSSMEDFDDDSDVGKIESDEDSEVEFEQYLRKSKTLRLKTFMKEHCWQYEPKKPRKQPNDVCYEDEYELWPEFENMSINSKPRRVELFGTVDSTVESVVLIKPSPSLKHIFDLETVIFNKDREAIGTVCDLVGTVRNTLYCMKSSSSTTKDQLSEGTELFYAPDGENLTKKLIEVKLQNNWEENENHGDEDETVFSDDEKEVQFLRRKKATDNDVRQPQNGPRKRNRVHFQQPEGQHFLSDNSRGRGGWTRNQTRRLPNQQTNNNAESVEDRPRREPLSTPDNPYAEFGCYSSQVDVTRIYRKDH